MAGVLAHEIGHIVERHVVKELNIHGTEGSASSGLARLIGGGSDAARVAFYQSVDKALDILFKTGYKRDDEVQADRDALLFCALAGYDPAGLVRYFERLSAAKGKNTEVLDKTHPSYETRLARFKATMTEEGMDPGTFKIFKERFAEVAKIAK
jgi:beta-barrel assembly-enhancing protease